MDQNGKFIGENLKTWQHWGIIIVAGAIGLGMTGYGVISLVIDIINQINS